MSSTNTVPMLACLVATLFNLISCAASRDEPIRSSTPVSSVMLEKRESFSDIYLVASGECELRWEKYNGRNEGYLTYAYTCEAPVEVRLELMESMIDHFLSENNGHFPFDSLGIGRIEKEQGLGKGTLSRRLSLAAEQSKLWDGKLGKPLSKKDTGSAIYEIMKTNDLFKEYRELFASRYLTLKLSSVEKVLVANADEILILTAADHKTLNSNPKLPFDCSVDFDISPTEK